jgi:hypothetical protein
MPAMREAIEQYVAREEERERLRQDASAGWEKYQADGLHVTAIEADAWLAIGSGRRHRAAGMPSLIRSLAALRDVERLYQFVAPKKPQAASAWRRRFDEV